MRVRGPPGHLGPTKRETLKAKVSDGGAGGQARRGLLRRFGWATLGLQSGGVGNAVGKPCALRGTSPEKGGREKPGWFVTFGSLSGKLTEGLPQHSRETSDVLRCPAALDVQFTPITTQTQALTHAALFCPAAFVPFRPMPRRNGSSMCL